MESPLVRRLRLALVEEAVKSGMNPDEAPEKIAGCLRQDIVQTVRDCITVARGRPASVPAASTSEPKTEPSGERW